jgi:hypothetical protein
MSGHKSPRKLTLMEADSGAEVLGETPSPQPPTEVPVQWHPASPEHHKHAAPPPARSRSQLAVIAVALGLTLAAVTGGAAWGAIAWMHRGTSAPSAAIASGAPTAGTGTTQADVVPSLSVYPEALSAAKPTLLLGDSLALDVYPWLADLLPDRYVSYEAKVGRTTSGTAAALAKLTDLPPVVIVSSGTNDPSASALEAAASQILTQLGADRCIVWFDVARPDSAYAPAAELNAALARVISGRTNVHIFEWSAMAAGHPEWFGSDGIHPNQDGTKARAQAMAAASLACSPLDPAAPVAKKQILPMSMFWGPVSPQPVTTGGGASTSAQPSSGTSGTPVPSANSATPTSPLAPSPTASGPAPTGAPSTAPPPTPSPSASSSGPDVPIA